MKQNPEIEICIESSAKENIRIRKVLEASRIAANYPSSPLFDQNRILKPQCMSALTRIFRLLDTDNDGCLSEEDVDSFEIVELTNEAVEFLKEIFYTYNIDGNPEIEICIESSAKENIRIRKVLEASRIATNYPSSPLFDQNRILKPQCMSALTRIFRLLDTDNDGCLSEEDVDSFEYTCFHTLRLPPEMNNLKKEVAEILIDGVYDGGLTLTGFYHYFRRLREEGRLDLAWEVLKSFGWKDDSKFEIKFNVNFDQFNGDDFQQIEEQTRGMIVELTNEAVEFLKEIFYTYDIDGDGTLKGSEVEDFLPTAHGSDWSKGLYEVVAELGGLSIDKFLSEWVLLTFRNPATSVMNLMLIGYHGTPFSAIRVTERGSINGDRNY
ncbi:mitochondrial Rho GTPase 1-like isoform X3 [Apium graveolens]|uniref:mitochondrial Rho GTPase 1-like isoform X3 n=1 Tax=Apium graveolens TaxID=4045 RepID=UPI003D78DFE9